VLSPLGVIKSIDEVRKKEPVRRDEKLEELGVILIPNA
jgi:hypothetical protein